MNVVVYQLNHNAFLSLLGLTTDVPSGVPEDSVIAIDDDDSTWIESFQEIKTLCSDLGIKRSILLKHCTEDHILKSLWAEAEEESKIVKRDKRTIRTGFFRREVDADTRLFEEYESVVMSLKDVFFESMADFLFQGVDLSAVRAVVLETVSKVEATSLAIILAMRGPNAVTRTTADAQRIRAIKLGNERPLGIIVNLVKSKVKLSQVSAAFADVSTYGLMKLGDKLPKKFNDLACPSYAQWLGLSGIPMPLSLKVLHKQFCQRFASVLPESNKGHTFNEPLYETICSLDKPHLSAKVMEKVRAKFLSDGFS